MAQAYGTPAAVADALYITAAGVWLVLSAGWLRRLIYAPRLVVGELRDPVVSPFGSLPAICGLLFAFAGYTVLMGLVQVCLLPRYLTMTFSPAFWAFTFTWTSVAAFGIRWLVAEPPAGATVYAAVAAGVVSVLVAAIAVRSLVS